VGMRWLDRLSPIKRHIAEHAAGVGLRP